MNDNMGQTKSTEITLSFFPLCYQLLHFVFSRPKKKKSLLYVTVTWKLSIVVKLTFTATEELQ